MKIIVVEDEPKSREGILNILARDTEYEVAAVCGNGKEGLEAVRKYRPDLVISDNCVTCKTRKRTRNVRKCLQD